jgi:DNA repair photolyase
MDGLRWPTVGEDAGPQGALFDADDLAERHVGRGEFAGYEFLHVNARSIINEVPTASRMPFRYTINAYRGCSHACSYCLVGDTSILMPDGRTRALSDIKVGDVVLGTMENGTRRRYVRSAVLDHWETRQLAYRVVLGDGRSLTSSGDHRFLTQSGWAPVAGTSSGADRRPGLRDCVGILRAASKAISVPLAVAMPSAARSIPQQGLIVNDRLMGVVPTAGQPSGLTALEVSSSCAPVTTAPQLDVVSVEPLGVELSMYDMTTETGDFVANGVVSHNCFARPTHEYLGLGIGEDFERKIVVKVNAVERVRAELAGRRWAGHHIAMGTNTDPYQRCEGKYHLTRGVIGALSEASNPFSILTKSTLVLRDLDLLVEAATRTDVRVNLSIGTLDEDVWRRSEPGTPAPRLRVDAVRRLNEAGIPCGVLVAPVLPGLSDRPDQLEAVVGACVAAGAVSISTVGLHLRGGVRDHYLQWLGAFDPALADEIGRRYRKAYLPAAEQRALRDLVRGMVQRARRTHGTGRFASHSAATRRDGAVQ